MKKRSIICILFAVFSSFLLKDACACFTYNESHYTIRASGSTFFQDCVCEEPVLTTHNIKWLDGNNRVINATNTGSGIRSKVYTEQGPRYLRLNIDKASPSLSGTYKCVSKDLNGTQYFKSYTIEFYDPLYFTPANITPQYVTEGRDSLILCQGRGYYTPRISWYKGKEEIEIIDNDKYDIVKEGLLIKNGSKDDAGEYHCTARVLYTGEDVDTVITVEVMTPPNVEDILAVPDYVIYEGDQLTLVCKASGYPLPTYTWTRIGDQNNNTDKNLNWKVDFNKVIVENVTMEDQGVYECIAQNIASEARSNISIEVLAPPTISEFENITAAEGSTVSIVCGAIGRPQPYINITYDGELQESPGYYSTNEDPTYAAINLTFERVQRYHGGQYDCTANNSVGADHKAMNLIVHHKPIFDTEEETIWGWEDHAVNLSCEHIANPTAHVEWSFVGNPRYVPSPIQLDVYQFWVAKVQKVTEHYIHFKPMKLLYGTYECVARNHLGEAKKVFHVKQGFRPPLLGKNQVNITEVAATSATFEFTGIEFEGPPIIGFTAEYDEAKKYEETHIHFNRTWAQNVLKKIDKLKPNTAYQARFAAINDVGTGPFGQYYTFETPAKSAPEPPSWLDKLEEPVMISIDNKILKLKAPEENGDPIDYYAVRYCPENSTDSCIEEIVSRTTELDLSHLQHNTTYRVELIAHNSMGNSSTVSLLIHVEGSSEDDAQLTGGAIIGVAIVVVILCIVILDVILLVTKKKGVIASCMYRKSKKKKIDIAQSKDKKGLLKDNTDVTEALNRPDNGHKEFEYNKGTGIVTGKHSAV